jgi:hypothetical protein
MTHPVPTIPFPKNRHDDGDDKTDEENTKDILPTQENEIHHGNEQASKYPGGHDTFCAFMNDHEAYGADER